MGEAKSQVIYHMTSQLLWDAQADRAEFSPQSLADEGFIHCTAEPERLVQVANQFYRDLTGAFIIVRIVPERLTAELRWESADGHLFPHLYGPLNRSAVDAIIDFPRLTDGTFFLTPEMRLSTL